MKIMKGLFVGLLMVVAVFFVSSASIITDTLISADDITISDDLIVGDDVTIYGTLNKPQDTAIKAYSNTSDVIGEPMPLELYGVIPEAKPFIQWRTYYFDNNQSTMVYDYTAWMGAHYNSSLLGDRHQHFAIETLDLNTSTVNTRFAIDYGRFFENMTAYFNAINYVELRTGVDLRFKQNGVEKAQLEWVNNTGFEISTSSDNITLNPDENVKVGQDKNLVFSGDADIINDDILGFYVEGSDTIYMEMELDDSEGNFTIAVRGGEQVLKLSTNVKIESLSGQTGALVCVKDDDTLGRCSDDPGGGGGTCTCI